jgi:cation diffusion facilitator CzcD-associated flavoprotein CzcO
MSYEKFGVPEGEHIPGTTVNRYLETYAEKYGISKHIRYGRRVTSAEKRVGGGWKLDTEVRGPKYQNSTEEILCQKLVVATGLTSTPLPSKLPEQEKFGAPILSFRSLADSGSITQLTEDDQAKTVAVLGASKSGYDAVYTLASAGKKVNWIIKKTGYGPNWMSPSHMFVPGFGNAWLEKLVTTR